MKVSMWRVVAGRGGWAVQSFLEGNYVSLGWSEVGDATRVTSAAEMLDRFKVAYPAQTERQCSVGASQLWRFLKTVTPGDEVISYDRDQRRYHFGVLKGDPTYVGGVEELQTRRAVQWRGGVNRDDLSEAARASLGAILTLMLVPIPIADEIRALLTGKLPPPLAAPIAAEVVTLVEDLPDAFAGIEEQAIERIKDRIAHLSWEQMQELVAALLRAAGYRTSVSARGPDRGRDILATPDGFGFQAPRIIVEVKHCVGQTMGAPDVRAMPVGRQVDDRGLFVSTGGFTREAYYEAEHGKVPITLMTLDDLTRAIIDAYPKFDDAGRALLPLRPLYWPVG